MKTDILVVGGGPAGIVVSMSARAYYPEKKVIVVKSNSESVVPCGIPYMFGKKLENFEDNLIPCGNMAKQNGVELLVDEVIDIDYENKKATLKCSEEIEYEKLVFATGSTPKRLTCGDIGGVHYVSKNPEDLRKMYETLENIKNVTIIGTGFIGVEVAFELYEKGKNVSIIGNQLLGKAFDGEFIDLIEEIVIKDGIKHYKAHLKEIKEENGKVVGVVTDKGDEIESEAVIVAIGYSPNTELAHKTGLSLRGNFIYVDEYMRTVQKDVFAVGDCAQKRDFITKRSVDIMLASTATAEARTAVSALYGIKYAKTFSGTIAIFSTVVGKTCFASAGVTEDRAKHENMDIEVATVVVDDKHPAKLPNSRKQTIKLICMRRSGVVIGAQLIGGMDVGEMINILGLAIENQVNIYSLINLQVATHPLLTSAPTAYPIAKAAQMLDIKINK
jgi:NADPH-dependent 2,4-dienoyl-CoA reductase/sulfur reductase-like enzyme